MNITKYIIYGLYGLLISLIIILLGLVYINFMTPYKTGISAGGSMQPTYDNGCQFVINKKYTGGELSEGDIVSYKKPSSNDNMYTSHRIIKKYESYDPTTAKYQIRPVDNFQSVNTFIIKQSDSIYISYSTTQQTTSKQLEGKTVYILKGDNNDSVDPYLVTKEHIKYTPTELNRIDILPEIIKIFKPDVECID